MSDVIQTSDLKSIKVHGNQKGADLTPNTISHQNVSRAFQNIPMGQNFACTIMTLDKKEIQKEIS